MPVHRRILLFRNRDRREELQSLSQCPRERAVPALRARAHMVEARSLAVGIARGRRQASALQVWLAARAHVLGPRDVLSTRRAHERSPALHGGQSYGASRSLGKRQCDKIMKTDSLARAP